MKLSGITIILLTGIFLISGCTNENETTQSTDSVTQSKLIQQTHTPLQYITLPVERREPSMFPQYIEQLKLQAGSEGIEQSVINQAFDGVYFVERVVQADRNQLEKKITLDDYLKRVLPAWKVKQAKEKYQEYKEPLSIATSRYGVPERYIIALWGLESSFGKIQGKEDVISALSTLAFEGRREAFFIDQLMAALHILQNGTIQRDKLKGSWAGAMGQSQFMPTSYLRYGADGNGDGYIDIWNNVDDVFASIANYLAREGWQPGVTWGREVKIPANFNIAQAGLKDEQSKKVGEWQQVGIVLPNGNALPVSENRAWIILPDDAQGRAFMVYDNFRVLMHWNRSYYFAISVGMMADRIIM